jgi:hypothetical protein
MHATSGSQQDNRECNATSEEIEGTGSLGRWIVEFEVSNHLQIRGLSVKRVYQGWTLCIRATMAGEPVVAFAHLWRFSELGTAARTKIEGDDWKADKFAKSPADVT